ncbi:hypothetical protein [Curtobacterium sp. MCBD17_040]|uniref:hypothetical protein n=1 Tax=Curtobacterium sp. MCBD17_040 TaxID=2175674 RepID=UPI000DA96882|nr:hypothetical protein [Curtobacterium sp. MCBD17_040]WIB65739.1 hypothetical protein DEI94_16605 [Curtobacterium sp. MCBD17_040]
MRDETDPGVTAAELQALYDRASLEASARGLRVLLAETKEPEVLFLAPNVPLDDALDVAVAGGATWVTVREEYFDAVEFLDGAGEVPTSIRNAAGGHDGDRTGIQVRWVSAGTSYAYWARATWNRDLAAELEEWQEDEDERREREDRDRRTRTWELIRAAIDDPGIRAAKPASRKSLIEAFIRARVDDPDRDVAAAYAMKFAPQRVAEEWREAYALLDQTAAIFITDLREQEEWQQVKWNTAVRRDVLRRFATSRTGGWAPTDTWVKEVDRQSRPPQ